MQRIVIKNFGPIKDVDISIHDFMIFIGPQASGKSTIAKLIYFFRSDIIAGLLTSLLNLRGKFNSVENLNEVHEEITIRFQESWKYFPVIDYEVQFYYSETVWIKLFYSKLPNSDSEPSIAMSEELTSELNLVIEPIFKIIESSSMHHGYGYDGVSLIASDFLTKVFGNPYHNIFIPAGRSIFSILANQIQILNGDRTDEMVRAFSMDLNDLRRKDYPALGLTMHSDAEIEKALTLYRDVLKGSYLHEKSNDNIQIGKGLAILLEQASSGQQESVWPLLLLFNTIREKERTSIVFEEPEAHLYPVAQKQISELTALCVNIPNNRVMITTHSPYILSALNNLLYANEVGKTHPDQVGKVVDKNLWLDYDRVMAYFVDEGKVRSIMDDELRLIKSEEIDSASQIINREYDSLADIKFAK